MENLTKPMKINRLLIPCLCFFAALQLTDPAAAETDATDPALNLIQALGCKGCHTIKGDGGSLASDLTQVGSRLTAAQISARLTAHTEARTKGFMPSYNSLGKADLNLISQYLYNLR